MAKPTAVTSPDSSARTRSSSGSRQEVTAARSSRAGSRASAIVTGTRLLFWYGVSAASSSCVPTRATGIP